MSQIRATTKRRSWRRNTYIWVLSALAAVSALLYWEQTALLYVITTLAMCALLFVVALADLEGRDKELNKPVKNDPPRVIEVDQTSTSADLNNPQEIDRRKGAA